MPQNLLFPCLQQVWAPRKIRFMFLQAHRADVSNTIVQQQPVQKEMQASMGLMNGC